MEGNNKYHPSDAAFAPLTYNQLVLFSLTLQTTTIFLDIRIKEKPCDNKNDSLKADRYFYFLFFRDYKDQRFLNP